MISNRSIEKFIGVGIFGISLLFFALVIYFLVIAIENKVTNPGIIVVELVFSLIGYSLAILSIRLITGKGKKGSTYLLSSLSLLIWGTVFGVAGIIEIFIVMFQGKIELLFPAIVGIIMGLGSYNLVKKRRLKSESKQDI